MTKCIHWKKFVIAHCFLLFCGPCKHVCTMHHLHVFSADQCSKHKTINGEKYMYYEKCITFDKVIKIKNVDCSLFVWCHLNSTTMNFIIFCTLSHSSILPTENRFEVSFYLQWTWISSLFMVCRSCFWTIYYYFIKFDM